jgi:hypothetical protein
MTTTFDEALRAELAAAQMTPEELRLELALALYQRGTLPFGKARELAGVSAWGFQDVGAVHDNLPEYEANLATLRERGRR